MREQESRAAVADLPDDPRNLLTEQERDDLYADLERMARLRRRAAANAANMSVG